jgi:outer membrane protein
MRMAGSFQRVALACALAALVAAPHPAGAAEAYKIGVIHIERILRDSAPARSALERIEQEFKPRDTAISAREQEVRAASAQYEKEKAGLDAETRATRERELEARTRDVERQRQQFAEDLRTRQFEELDKLKERMDQVLTRLAHDEGYDLILQSALWVGKSVDITDQVIKALGP